MTGKELFNQLGVSYTTTPEAAFTVVYDPQDGTAPAELRGVEFDYETKQIVLHRDA